MTIEIEQDHEAFEDGEIGGPMQVFWARGHAHDPDEFVRAVIDYSLSEHGSVPAIDWEDKPVECWQRNTRIGDGIRYDRSPEPGGSRHSPGFPITILDLERPRYRGAPKCALNGCTEPWARSSPIRIIPLPDSEYEAIEIHLCRKHLDFLPEQSYRTVFVPIGAEVRIPATPGTLAAPEPQGEAQ